MMRLCVVQSRSRFPRRLAPLAGSLVFGLLVLVLPLVAACAPVESGAVEATAGTGEGVEGEVMEPGRGEAGGVLLELFTSQGCSSCPPADRLLTELAEDPALEGRVFPLAFHVDYWNYIGWTDPFSSERWSQRQRAYGRVLEDGRVYTPQLVIDGRRHLVGSRRGEVRRAVEQALAQPSPVRIELQVLPVRDGRLPVEVRAQRVEGAEDGKRGEALELWIALWQDGLVTPVGRGENADRTLHNDRVVRRLVRVGTLPPPAEEAGAVLTTRDELELEPGWPRRDLGVVAFVQGQRSRTIHGATGQALAPPRGE